MFAINEKNIRIYPRNREYSVTATPIINLELEFIEQVKIFATDLYILKITGLNYILI